MTFKKIAHTCVAFCLVAVLGIAACGCDDLGAYSDVDEYYSSFGDIVLVKGTSREESSHSVKKSFYNEESRDNFLNGEYDEYKLVDCSDYVYMAIPVGEDVEMEMDTLALYMQSQSGADVYINVFITNQIPSNWKGIADIGHEQGEDGSEISYDDPNPQTRVGEIVIHLEEGKWDSFVLDQFQIDGTAQNSIQIKDGQFILLQFRNNSGVREFDEGKQAYVDPQTGLVLQKAEFTMTNLLVRALERNQNTEVQGGES